MSARSSSSPPAEFSGLVAVVVGASRGVGAEITRRLVASEACVAAVARDEGRLAELAAGTDVPDAVLSLPGDIADDNLAEHVARRTFDRFGRIDMLVNCAAVSPVSTALSDTDPGVFSDILRANVLQPWRFATAVIKHGLSRGAIVNIGSSGGLKAVPQFGPYGVSKAALHHLTRQMAVEYAPHIRVNAVAPATFESHFSQPLLRSRPHIGADNPLQRVGTPGDVAGTVLHLLSSQASWITGQVWSIDGGAEARGEDVLGRGD